jgi:Uma2 family endonuclease
MAVAELVPLAEYLRTTYHPDREYLEGELKERNVGEMDHGDAQLTLAMYVRQYCKGFWATVETRAQVKANRFRVPDVSIVRGGKPKERFFKTPPLVVVEVLSPEDRFADLQSKIDDYLAFGVDAVWVLDPETKRAFMHKLGSSHEVMDGVLREADLVVPLDEVFND